MAYTCIDTTQNVSPNLPALAAAGVKAICRYIPDGLNDSYKWTNAAEVNAIRAAGITFVPNFEGAGNNIYAFSAPQGQHDAALAKQFLQSIGAPAGTAVYFSCEPENAGNENAAYQSNVLPYFQAVRSVLSPTYRVGAYTFGTWLDALMTAGLIDFAWLPGAAGWSGYYPFYNSKRWALHQIPGALEQQYYGAEIDGGEVNSEMTDWGGWAPSGQPVPQPTPTPAPVEHPLLLLGSSGPDVVALQAALGKFDGAGTFGPLTDSAVRAFQSLNSLYPDGKVGPMTRAKLGLPA